MADIHHIHIRDDETGELLADVDASSTADGLVYFLRHRRAPFVSDLDRANVLAEAEKIERAWVTSSWPTEGSEHERFVYTERHPISNVIEYAVFAEEAN